MRLRTGSAFILLFSASWLLELGLGIGILQWYWGTAWYSGRTVGQQKSMAETIASLSSSLSTALDAQKIDLHWTPEGVLTFFTVFYLVLHLMYAAYSLLGPFFRRHYLGARQPSRREQERFDRLYQALARTVIGVSVVRPRRFLVADGSGLQIRYIGYILVVDRELLWHRHFMALLAVELAHANSEDRLARRLYAILPNTASIAGILGGLPFAVGNVLLFPLWAWYWRERIFSADAFAVTLGQGRALVRALDEVYLKLDQTSRGGRWLKHVPYIEQRIDRIERELTRRNAVNRAPRVI